MKHRIFFIVMIWMQALATTAQESAWNGIVTDAVTEKPVAGAIIASKADIKYSCLTNDQGQFTITLPDYISILEVVSAGYEAHAFHLPRHGEEIAICLQPELGASAASTALTVEENLAIQGVGGLRVVGGSANPAQGAMLMLGGIHSLNGGTTPLVVVDGVPIDLQNGRGLMHRGYTNNVLSAISPDDIERVSVISNATALYGAKGAGGVILIETKRAQSMATRIDINVHTGMEGVPRLPRMMNSDQYREYAADVLGNATSVPEFLSDQTADMKQYAMYHNNTDWGSLVYRKALTQHYGINVQGGDEVAKYNLGINYTDAESTLRGNDFNRLALRFNTDVNILEPLTVQLDVAYSNTGRNLRDDGIEATENFAPASLALIKSPLLNPYMNDEKGQTTSSVADYDVFGISNPLAVIEGGEAVNKNSLDYSMFFMNICPRWNIGKCLTVSERVGYVLNNVTERYFLPDEGVPTISTGAGVPATNESRAYSSKQVSLVSDTRIAWLRVYDAHRVEAFGGFRYMSDTYNNDGIGANNAVSDKMPNITSAMDNRVVTGVCEQWKSTALYLLTNYNYADRYSLTASLTGETSTRFGSNVEEGIGIGRYVWALFPSLQVGWNISSERFFGSVDGIDLLQLNAGVDKSGNDNIPTFASRTYFVATPFINNTSGLSLYNIGNDKLKWETTTRLTLGARMLALNGRLEMAVNGYRSTTDDLLVWKKLDGISGLSRYLCNEGRMGNIGFGFQWRARLLNGKNLAWDVRGDVNRYVNKVQVLPDKNRQLVTEYADGELLTALGGPVAQFYGYRTCGVFSTSEDALRADVHLTTADGYQLQAGDPIYVDANNDHVIDDRDKVVIGNPNPDLFGSFGTALAWKRFTFDAAFTYSVGGDIYNYNRRILEQGGSYYNQTTAMLRRWVCEGQLTDVPHVNSARRTEGYGFTDRWIEDGSYLKLKRVAVSYHRPLQLSFVQGITVWVAADNMLTLSRYLGSDPEVSCSRGVLYQGIDMGLLGDGRSVSLGVKLNL